MADWYLSVCVAGMMLSRIWVVLMIQIGPDAVLNSEINVRAKCFVFSGMVSQQSGQAKIF